MTSKVQQLTFQRLITISCYGLHTAIRYFEISDVILIEIQVLRKQFRIAAGQKFQDLVTAKAAGVINAGAAVEM